MLLPDSSYISGLSLQCKPATAAGSQPPIHWLRARPASLHPTPSGRALHTVSQKPQAGRHFTGKTRHTHNRAKTSPALNIFK